MSNFLFILVPEKLWSTISRKLSMVRAYRLYPLNNIVADLLNLFQMLSLNRSKNNLKKVNSSN